MNKYEKIFRGRPVTDFDFEEILYDKGDLAWTTLQHARDWLSVHYATGEPIEGFSAFLEKRKVDYRGMRQKSAEGGSHTYMHGAPLQQCNACGTGYLPEEFAFCGKCGQSLGTD